MKTLSTTVRAELVEADVRSPSFRATTRNPALKRILRLLSIFGLMMLFAVSGWGVQLGTTDTFTGNNNKDGWDGSGESWDSGSGGRLLINNGQTGTKTFTFAAYPNQVVRVTLVATKTATWESSDLINITANGTGVYNLNIDGSITFDATLNGSGQLALVVTPNTNNNNEDIYIDDVTINTITPAPEINVVGNGNNITDPNTIPSATDNTDFGITYVNGGQISKTFTIQNTGTVDLSITGVTFFGGNSTDFSVTTPPALTIAPGGFSDFTVRFTAPSTAGARTTEMRIASNDSNEAIYNISIKATGEATDAVNDTYTTGISMILTVNAATGLLNNDTGFNKRVVSNTNPAHGVVSVNTDGSFSYTPISGYLGEDTFDYTITSDDGQTNLATVTIHVQTVTVDNIHSFDRVNPDTTQYVRGNYKVAGNTLTCLVNKTSGYGYDVSGNAMACLDIGYELNTSNSLVNRYIDIDSDTSTWNSSSSYITFPSTYDNSAGRGVLWAGLFWQGRVAWKDAYDSDYSLRYAKVNGSTYNYTETHALNTVNIHDTNAENIKLKIDSGTYSNIQASTFYNTTSGDGTTYAAFADVTEIVKNASINDGKHVFTVANLTTEEGREANPGLFGGWSLVVIYAEDVDGKTRNINVYNGLDLLQSGSTNPSFPLTGLKLPTTGAVHATLSLFSGEGEYRYGYRPDNTSKYDWVKLSNNDSTYDYMPGAITNDNIFDGKLSNVSRDTITGKYNDLSANNNGVDVDSYDVSTLVTGYRDANQNLDRMYIKWDTNEDYITPSMLAFATELYEPILCYDYTLKQDGRYLSVDRTDPIARINQPISSSPIDILVYLRNKEADIPANGISIKADVNATRFGYTATNPIYVSNPNGSALIDRGEPVANFPADCTYSLSSGNGVTNQGCVAFIENNAATTEDDIRRIRKGNGTLGSEAYIYSKFTINPQQISGIFEDINESLGLSLDYYIQVGSTPIPYHDYILGGPNVQMCTPSSAYLPTWGLFNVVQHGQVQNNLKTQIARKPFDVDVIYDQVISTGVNDAPSSTVNTTVQVEMIDVDSFGDLNASCANPDAGVSEPIIVPIAFTPNPAPAYQMLVTPQDSSYHNFALKNGAYRVWYFTETNGTLIQNWTATTDPNSKNKTVTGINGLFNSTSHGDCNSTKPVPNCSDPTSSDCFTCMKNNYGKPLCSRDNFSVRPEAFDIRIKDYDGAGVNSDLSHDVYGTAPDKNATTTPATLPRINLAAGYDYKYDINATGTEANMSGLTAVPRYTRYFNGPRSDYNITMMWDSPLTNAVCNDVAGRSLSFFIANGMRANQQEHLDQVGDYRLNMIDTSWTAVDKIAHIHTIDNGFTAGTDCLVGYNDTGAGEPYGCDISSQHINGSLQYKDQNMNFKPAQFGLPFSYSLGKTVASTITAGGQGFVYMSDLNNTNDMNMSVRSTGQIRALGADGVLTTNFVGGCFAKDLNVTAIHDANLTYTTPFVTRMINSTIANVQTYDSLETVQASNWIGTVDDTNFTKADNGALVNTIRFNFDRNQTTPHDPQTVTYSDINVTCALSADCNQSSIRNSTPNTAVGSSAMDFNVTHTYGRVIAKDQRVMGLIAFDGLARYEVYKTDHIFGTLLTVDPDYGDWYINTLHNELTYGDASVTVVDPTTGSSLPNILTSTYAAGIETYKFNAFTVRQGYKAHIDTEGWLWNGIAADIYKDPVNPVTAVDDCDNHPCFNITFGRIIGNTGSAKTESENAKANKNSSSGTGWHSTSEYAPSVR